MRGLYAHIGPEGQIGPVVDSGTDSRGKWVTVLDDAGKAVTRDEASWRFLRDEELLRLHPGVLEEAKRNLDALKVRLRNLPEDEPETHHLRGVHDGMERVLHLVETASCRF